MTRNTAGLVSHKVSANESGLGWKGKVQQRAMPWLPGAYTRKLKPKRNPDSIVLSATRKTLAQLNFALQIFLTLCETPQ
jgi:hypothetical protein